jgi:ABC-type dipeptide/oligopeptide/nickel transport system ATPase component
MHEYLMEVHNLTVRYPEFSSRSPVIRDVTFSLPKAQALALVGESGSGKTTLCRALTRLFPPHVAVEITGTVRFGSINLLTCGESALADIRQNSIRYVFQEPYSALNPISTIEKQLLLARGRQQPTREEMIQLLADVGLPRPEGVLTCYPHELSVGMAQRVMIAMALLPTDR